MDLTETRASYYDILPKGVMNLTYHLAITDKIAGSYSRAGEFKGYNVNATINADALKGINSNVDSYLDSLSNEDYKALSFGTFKGTASSKVQVQAIGVGYGLLDKMTVYGFIPFYKAQVDLNLERTQNGRNTINTDVLQIDQLPNVDARLIQSLFVNYYHYRPLGQWSASNFGDAEIGAMIQTHRSENEGYLLSFGVVAPTGKIDNPDILQDISFGDGQWDGFIEFGGGFSYNSFFSIENWLRATYQFPFKTSLRLPQSYVFPIGQTSSFTKVKLGNKFKENIQGIFQVSDVLSFSTLYSFEYTEKSSYRSGNALSDEILESNTEKIQHAAKIGANFSTLKLFSQKDFLLPVTLSLSLQDIFAGKNIPRYKLYEAEIRFFF